MEHKAGGKKMKTLLTMTLFACAIACLNARAELLYRGRLTQGSSQNETRFDPGAAYKMTFRVYDCPQGGEARYTFTSNAVSVRVDGGFEVLLSGPELDAALDVDGRSAYVGLALDDGRELMPRRQILMAPRVVYAEKADAPGGRPHFAHLTAHAIEAGPIGVQQLNVGGALTTTDSKDRIAMQGIEVPANARLDLRGKRVTVLGDVETLVSNKCNVNAGDTLAVAPEDGLAYIYSSDFSQHSSVNNPKVTGLTRFCRKGEAIPAPVSVFGSEGLAVRFYSFATR